MCSHLSQVACAEPRLLLPVTHEARGLSVWPGRSAEVRQASNRPGLLAELEGEAKDAWSI